MKKRKSKKGMLFFLLFLVIPIIGIFSRNSSSTSGIKNSGNINNTTAQQTAVPKHEQVSKTNAKQVPAITEKNSVDAYALNPTVTDESNSQETIRNQEEASIIETVNPERGSFISQNSDAEESVLEQDVLYAPAATQEADTYTFNFMPKTKASESLQISNKTTTIQYKDGSIYEGQATQGQRREGEGNLNWKTGESYNGSWTNDQLNGNGTLTWPGIGIYVGEFVNGKREGKGRFTWVYDTEPKIGSPESFEGNWKNDKIGDSGKLVLIGIGTYEGQFSKQVRNGQGVFTWESGEKYEGSWREDAINGKGKLTLADGTCLDGTFVNGVLNKGTMTYVVDGGIAKRKVVSGKLEESIEIVYENKTVVTGKIKNHDFTGKVTIQYISGDKYVGTLKKGLKNGTGTYTWKNGAHYIGEWKNDKMSGEGKYYYGKSEVVNYLSGKFENGRPNGKLTYVGDNKLKYETIWSQGRCTSITYKK